MWESGLTAVRLKQKPPVTVNKTHVHSTCIYFMHMCIDLYIILLLLLLLLLSHSTLVNNCFRGELPETFSIQVNMRRVVFYVSIHQLFISFGGGGRKANIVLYMALVSNFCKIRQSRHLVGCT